MSLLRNCPEVNPPKVAASLVIRLPSCPSKHPAVSLKPLLNVEVAPEVKRMLPPEMVRPEEVGVNPAV